MICRKGESLALTWKDIDFVREEVRIRKSLNRKQSSQGMKETSDTPLAASDIGWHLSDSRSYEITTPKNRSSYRNVLMPHILIVSQRLGHSDITQTLNIYSHLMPNVQKQIINALDFEM